MSVDPKEWLDLHWVKNHDRFYYSAAKIGHPNQKSSHRRDAFEVIKPESQCKKALECMNRLVGLPGYNENLKNKSICYISGLPITQEGGRAMVTPGGCQCEHILTASTIAMLTGLPSDIYKSERDLLINGLKKKSSMKSRFDEFISGYEGFQNELWAILYDWAHPACNEYKGDHPFLRIDFKSKGLKIVPLSQTSDNIKKLLAILFYSETDTSGGETKLSKWRDEIVNKHLHPATDIDAYVQSRYDSIFHKVDFIEKTLQKYKLRDNGELLKHYSYLSTKTMLNVVIHKVLQLGPFKWVNPLQTLFKQSGKDLDKYIQRKSNTKVSLRKFMSFVKQQKGGGNDEIIYYTHETLPDDVILGALLVLQLQTPTLFESMNIDDMMFNIELLDVNEIIQGHSSDPRIRDVVDKFTSFCNFFRYYINSENSILYSVMPDVFSRTGLNAMQVNANFKVEVIGMTNYIWNVYSNSKDYNLREIIVDGSSDVADKLEKGPHIEENALEHIEIIRVIKLLEEMGNELKDDCIETLDVDVDVDVDIDVEPEPEQELAQEEGDETDNITVEEIKRMRSFMGDLREGDLQEGDEERPSKMMRGEKPKNKKRTNKKKRINVDTERDLRAMKFMIGDKVVSF